MQALGRMTLKIRVNGWTIIIRPYLELSLCLKEEAEKVIDTMEEDLQKICRELGFNEYLRPEATIGLVRVLEDSPSKFFLLYRREVENAFKAGISKVFLE